MNSTLRNGLVIVLVVALVATVTFVSVFTASPPPTPGGSGVGGGPEGQASAGPPLVFRDAEIHYDPDSENVAHRSFPGYFEVGDTVHWVSFWFQNRNPFPVRMIMRERSCTSCTSAKVAVVPDDVLRGHLAFAAAAGLPWSPFPLPDLLSPVGYAVNQNKLTWHTFNFDRPGDEFTVPPAADGRPTVGVLALGFTPKTVGPPNPVTAVAEAAGPDDKTAHPYPFAVTYAPRQAFDVYPPVELVGDLPEGAPPRTFNVLIYSTTRKPGDLPPPKGLAGGNDPFLTIGQPVPLTEGEAAAFARKAAEESKLPLRVQSGYRVPVTIHRDLPGRLPDVGTFEKTAHFSVPGSSHTVATQFRGRVTGLVKLDDGEKIDLGSYNSEYATRKSFRVYAARNDLELELDPAQSAPTFVQYALEPAPAEGSRKVWTIKVTIPAKQGRKPAWEGVVFLRAKGADGSRANIRLPVAGNGIGR